MFMLLICCPRGRVENCSSTGGVHLFNGVVIMIFFAVVMTLMPRRTLEAYLARRGWWRPIAKAELLEGNIIVGTGSVLCLSECEDSRYEATTVLLESGQWKSLLK